MESWDPDAPMNKTALDASMAAKGGKKERGISRIQDSTGVETQEQIIDPLSARCFSCPLILVYVKTEEKNCNTQTDHGLCQNH